MQSPDTTHSKIAEGQWGDNVSWVFYLSDELPDVQLCTAVYCLAMAASKPEQIVLARNKRGWEMLGGHIEPRESIEAALRREAMEEGGFCISRFRLFGYRRVTAREPIVNDHHGGYYPLVGYIPYFIATTDKELAEPSGEEILESRAFAVNSLPSLEDSQLAIIMAGLEATKKWLL